MRPGPGQGGMASARRHGAGAPLRCKARRAHRRGASSDPCCCPEVPARRRARARTPGAMAPRWMPTFYAV